MSTSLSTTLNAVINATPMGTNSTATIVGIVLRNPETAPVLERFLNGESPNGNVMMDRGEAAREIRNIAKKMNMPIDASVKNAKLSRIITKALRKSGVAVLRNGKIDVEALTAPSASSNE